MTQPSNPRPRYNGSIAFDPESTLGPVKMGVVTVNGSSPNAKATVLSFDGDRRRPQQVDVMRKVTLDIEGDKLMVRGESLFAVHEMKLSGDDAIMTHTLTLNGRCTDCGGA